MADYRNIIPFIKQVEGGLSKAKTDSASAYPVPDGSGYHTNKGVTWKAFESFKVRLGITDQAALIKTFYSMPDAIWGKIFKWGYWDAINGDNISSQAIADTLVDWAWGAGPGTAVKKLQDFLKLPATYKMDAITLSTLNAQVERTFLDAFSAFKKNWYLTLPNQSANYAGWAARLDSLYAFAKTNLGKGVALGTIILLALTFFFRIQVYVESIVTIA